MHVVRSTIPISNTGICKKYNRLYCTASSNDCIAVVCRPFCALVNELLLARLHKVYRGRLVTVAGVSRRLSSSSVGVCNTAHMQRNSPGAARGGPVVLRPVEATPC